MGFHIWKLEVRTQLEHREQFDLHIQYLIQNDRIEMVPADQCGIFYDRDTYIIYAAAPADIVVSPKTGVRLNMHHFNPVRQLNVIIFISRAVR